MAREALGVAVGDDSGGYPAAVGTCRAIDLFFDFFGDAPQDTVGMIMRFHEAPETQVFVAFLLAQEADLDEVGKHSLQCSRMDSPVKGRPGFSGPERVL